MRYLTRDRSTAVEPTREKKSEAGVLRRSSGEQDEEGRGRRRGEEVYSTLAALALVTCGFSTRLISSPFE